jgi:uncharacterized protein (DUF849 family)
VPITPAELAEAALAAAAAGAEAVHVHPRSAAGVESLAPADIAAAVRAVRERCPGLPVGVSTGVWITGGSPAAQLAAVTSWRELPATDRPDFASANVSDSAFTAVATALLDAGIGVEAGVWTVADAETLAATGLAARCARLLVEILDASAAEASTAAASVLARLDALGLAGPRLLHGENDATWPLVALAGRLGLPTRIGLEDTTVGPAGTPVRGNADLVRHALGLRGS